LLIESRRNEDKVGVGVGNGRLALAGESGNPLAEEVNVNIEGVEGRNLSVRVGEAGKMNRV
jgi:hypothetical protein